MRHRLGGRLGRFAALAVLVAAGIFPGAANAGVEPLILRIGTDQALETLNPFQSITYADYEMFQIQYDLLVSYGNDLKSAPGFAEEWSSSTDKKTHTFNIRENMKWSDGQPATCEDARWTLQLVLDAADSELGYLGAGYLDPSVFNAGVDTVTCTDPNTLTITTLFGTTLVPSIYVPILPKHVWSTHTPDQISDPEATDFFANEPPVVGSGPYVAIQWEPGKFIRFARNANYWGEQKGVADEIIYEQFETNEPMVQALQRGDLDYVRSTGASLFDNLVGQANIRTSEGFANGYTYLSFNTRATQEGYKGSTSALEDPAFRDALMWALDKQTLVDRVLNGHGVPGTTNVPPYHQAWHVEPANPRSFDIAQANSKLDAAGYAKGTDGIRVDKDGKAIELRLTWPDEQYADDAQFIRGWWEQLGIKVDPSPTEENALIELLYGAEAGGDANWDTYIWSWGGDPDPMSLVSLFTTDQLESGVNDCFYSNARYDELFGLQQKAVDSTERKQYLAEMQQLFYDAGCNTPLYYDSELHAMRTDKFSGWVDQPPGSGTPLFGFGYSGYLALTDASIVPTPAPTVATTPAPGATPGPTAAPTPGNTGSNTTPILIGAVIVIGVLAAGFFLMRRRAGPKVEEE